ncbi:hypothetical protein K437DRAFT_111357 [Tilletiaria anomala UBC 951]|uniref:Uncharacterized protein n=1 Tax=Tilletiaria anomala (strain ATCC 24038 / CBS 436.72 / UBC 951) TaxID=1037660 RepID=A0A066W4D8_TILAU|nr:uncharacterized protein K437DRAFT_111357 [Tilletiaria anomala UBC 951]KDN45929.1 hypothetical protein K437DRAFT_111357 [Tilletiaria anomala UBC 951]
MRQVGIHRKAHEQCPSNSRPTGSCSLIVFDVHMVQLPISIRFPFACHPRNIAGIGYPRDLRSCSRWDETARAETNKDRDTAFSPTLDLVTFTNVLDQRVDRYIGLGYWCGKVKVSTWGLQRRALYLGHSLTGLALADSQPASVMFGRCTFTSPAAEASSSSSLALLGTSDLSSSFSVVCMGRAMVSNF